MPTVFYRPRAAKPGTDWADTLALQLRALHLPAPVREYRFDPIRKWRFDCCWPDRQLFVECDGGEFTMGRHGRALGMQCDCEKWNAATLAGWRGLRFTGSQVRSGYAIRTLETALR